MPNIRITPQLVQQIRDVIDISDIASDITRLQKRGQRYLGLCPFHQEKTPSFSVDPDQGLYYCFGCGAGGDAIKLFMHHTGDDFPAAIESLASRYGVPLPAETMGREDRPRRDPTAALEAAAGFFEQQLRRSTFAQRYLDQRKISAELRQRYGLGYAPDSWSQLLETLGRHVPREDLEATGLIGRSSKSGKLYDRFRHRLMFPVAAPSGRLVGFGGRTLGDDRAKYVNTSETEYFHKGSLLYGFHLAKRSVRDSGKVLLVEGYFDVLGAAAAGIDWVVAGMGTALTPEQTRLLARYAREVIIGYDGDDAGEKAFQRTLPLLLAAGLNVRRARFPDGHDPDSLRLESGAEAVREAIGGAVDAVEIEIERLTPLEARRDPHQRGVAARAVADLLRPIRDSVVRYAYGQKAAERLMLPLDLLLKRSGAGPKLEVEPSAATASAPRLVRNEEEKALQLLLHSSEALPAAEDLPPPEVFFDSDCRNIYATFCALYRERAGVDSKLPSPRDILSRLDRNGHAIDRMAQLLLEEPDSATESLSLTLQSLRRRWRKQRQGNLVRQIRQAEEDGDRDLLAQLLEEKKALTRSLHPKSTGRLW